MAAVSDLLTSLQAAAPEAPQLTLKRVLLETAREFCLYTKAWRTTLAPIDVAADTPEYVLTLPAGTKLVDVMSAVFNDERVLVARTQRQLDERDPKWRSRTGTPRNITRVDTATVWLHPYPATAFTGGLRTRVALMPTLQATTLDDTLVDEHRDALEAGAIARLLLMPRREWSEKTTGAYHQQRFEEMKAEARVRAAAEHQGNVPRRVRYGGY